MSAERSTSLRASECQEASAIPTSIQETGGQRVEQACRRRGSGSIGVPNLRSHRLGIVILAILLLGFLSVGAVFSTFNLRYAGKIYPNVTVHGISLGEMTPELARETLERQFAAFLAQPVTLTFGDQVWTPTLAELGVRLEIDRAVEEAYWAGRGYNPIANLGQILAVYRNGLEIPLHLTIDQAVMQAYLLERATGLNRPATDARLDLKDGALVVTPAIAGQQVLVGETLHELTAALQSLTPQTVALRTRALLPRLSDAAIQEARAEIARLLAGPLTMTIEGRRTPIVWSLEELVPLIRIDRVPGEHGDTLAVTVNQEAVQAKLAELAEVTAIRGTLPRVDWNGGDLRIIKEGTPGRRLDEERALEQVLAALNAPAEERQLTLPFNEVPPAVTAANLHQLGITDLLGVGRSDFSGSAPYRIINIKAGMSLLHGVLVPPGEEFSFNETIGRIDASNGFVEGYAIVQNRTQLEWGGGICQDSTTMFRAAFWAGLPITERWGHSFYISWYDKYGFGEYGDGPGMDATIFTGARDFKFLNDTGHWLLIQTLVDTSRSLAEVRIYGKSDGRRVSLIGPTIVERIPAPTAPLYVADPRRPRGTIRQTDKARGGMTIHYTRIIERNGQIIERRLFETRFKPWPNIYEVNPADLGPDGRPITTRPVPTPSSATPTPAPETPPAESPAPPTDGQSPPSGNQGGSGTAEAPPAPQPPVQPEPSPSPSEGY